MDMAMDPTWGALEDAQHPRKLDLLRRLLAGENAVDPAQTTIWGETPKPQPIYPNRPAEPQAPGAAKVDLTPILEQQAAARKKAPTIYDTPYADRIRFLEAKARDAVWTRSKDAARYDLNRMQDLAERWISRSEGREQGESDLAGKVLSASEGDAVSARKERVQRILADMSRYKKGETLDRGEAGVWQETFDQATGQSEWDKAPVPPKPAERKVHSIGPRGNFYLDASGKPTVIRPPNEGGGAGPAPAGSPPQQRVPAAVASAVTKSIFENLDPDDPDAIARAMVQLRSLGIMPGGEGAPDGAPAGSAGAGGQTRVFRRGPNGQLERVK
jgi:hypothetical protein